MRHEAQILMTVDTGLESQEDLLIEVTYETSKPQFDIGESGTQFELMDWNLPEEYVSNHTAQAFIVTKKFITDLADKVSDLIIR
jgi:hypothetical protein